MEYRKRNLSGSWEKDTPSSLDDRVEQTTRRVCVWLLEMTLTSIQIATKLTRSILGCPRVSDNTHS